MIQICTIDTLITEVLLKSEKVNCKLKDNNTLWTPELFQSNLRVQYWNIRLKSTKQKLNANKRIQQIVSKMDKDSYKMICRNSQSLKGALKKH
jgi:hypothetical protein